MSVRRLATASVIGMSALWILCGCSTLLPSRAAPTPTYHLTKSVSLGAPDHWDYVVVDDSAHRVYVAHGDRVTVVDARDGAIVGQIAGFPGGTHGTAIIDKLGRGYTDDGDVGEAAAFDLKTLQVHPHLKAADDADGMAFDPVSGHVFIVDGHPGTVTVIDPKRDAVVATVQLSPDLEYAVTDDHGKLFVNGAGTRQIFRVDTATNQVDARWSIPDCESPHGLAIDKTHRRLFASCLNAVLVVVNIDSGEQIATLPIGKGSDAAAFDPKRQLVFSANGRDGTLTVIQEKDAQTFVVVATVTTAMTARTMDIDPQTGRLYVVAADPQPGAAPPAWSALAPPPVIPGSLKLLFFDPGP